MPSAAQEPVETCERSVERAHGRGKRQAQVTRRAERRTGHERDAGLVEQALAELDVRRRAFCSHRSLDVRKQIERTGGRHALEPRQAAHTGEESVVAPLELGAHVANAGLVPGERLARGRLRDRAGVRRTLALQARHRFDDGDRAGRVTDAPAAHRVTFRHSVDGNRPIVQIGTLRGEARETLTGPLDVLVNLVAQHDDARVRAQYGAERAPIRGGVHGARRVTGAVQDQEPRFRRQRARELLGRHLEATRRARRDDHGLGFGEPHHVRIRHPIRRDDDRFVAGVEQCETGVVTGLLRARGDQDLLGRVPQAIVARQFCDDCVLERSCAVDGRVLRVVARERGRGRRFDVLRRSEVRLADAEHDDVAALLAQSLRARRDTDGGGRANALQPLRDFDAQRGDLFLVGRGYSRMQHPERQPAPPTP